MSGAWVRTMCIFAIAHAAAFAALDLRGWKALLWVLSIVLYFTGHRMVTQDGDR